MLCLVSHRERVPAVRARRWARVTYGSARRADPVVPVVVSWTPSSHTVRPGSLLHILVVFSKVVQVDAASVNAAPVRTTLLQGGKAVRLNATVHARSPRALSFSLAVHDHAANVLVVSDNSTILFCERRRARAPPRGRCLRNIMTMCADPAPVELLRAAVTYSATNAAYDWFKTGDCVFVELEWSDGVNVTSAAVMGHDVALEAVVQSGNLVAVPWCLLSSDPAGTIAFTVVVVDVAGYVVVANESAWANASISTGGTPVLCARVAFARGVVRRFQRNVCAAGTQCTRPGCCRRHLTRRSTSSTTAW